MGEPILTTSSGISVNLGHRVKEAGWCEKHDAKHAWVDGPTLLCDPPIATRSCANCGKVQHLRSPQWADR